LMMLICMFAMFLSLLRRAARARVVECTPGGEHWRGYRFTSGAN
jgi:hypothetical protein